MKDTETLTVNFPRTAATATILVLTLISYAISYEQFYVVANDAGVWHPLTYGYGLLLEGFVSVATYTAFVAAGSWLAVYPWTVAISAFGFSAWVNASAGHVPPELVRLVPVILVPIGVHMLIVLQKANERLAAAATAPVAEPEVVVETVEVERIVEVPQEIGPDLDVSTVREPMAVAYKLMARFHDHPATRTYNKQRFEAVMSGHAVADDNNVPMLPLAA